MQTKTSLDLHVPYYIDVDQLTLSVTADYMRVNCTGVSRECGESARLRVYSDRTRQRQNDGVKHNALDLEHILVNWSIQTGRVASKNLYNRDAVDLTLSRPV